MPSRPARALALVSLAPIALAAVAGCGTASSSARPTRTVTASVTVTVTATPPTDGAAAAPTSPVPIAPEGTPDRGSTTSASGTASGTVLAVPSPSPHDSATPTPVRPSRPPAGPMNQATFAAEYDALRRHLSSHTGIAVVPVGSDKALVAGAELSDSAWSTIKVPITIAALAADGSERERGLARRTITVSDNEAASAQWGILGAGDTAAETVDRVLRDFGDAHTSSADIITAEKPWRFGMTTWAVPDAATFAAHLPCRAEAAPVLDLMGQIDPSQSWGLGHLDGARFKGGWGLQGDGFVTRQLGVVPTPHGQIGIAILARGGGMESGMADLDAIARWVAERKDRLPAGRCR